LPDFRACAFDGFYFCDACMAPDLYLIPAKVVYNWDFRKYAVSKKAATFLADYAGLPFIDLKVRKGNRFSKHF
jgi:pleckstrin homology domain-containing family M member 1